MRMEYDRFFAFGCSFSSWHWPTWADIIGREFGENRYYNLGICASGNEFAFHRLTEAHARYHITPRDLVIICWTNFAREDRWIDGAWVTSGNIFTQDYYDKDFVKKYFDLKGALIKTSSFIAGATHLLDSTGCDYVFGSAFPMRRISQFDDLYADSSYDEVFEVYKKYYDQVQISMAEYLYGAGSWRNPDPIRVKHIADKGKVQNDDHPNVLQHLRYAEEVLIPGFDKPFHLSDATREWALDWDHKTRQGDHYLLETGEMNFWNRWQRYHGHLL
jgi:hypothetical protein